MEAERARQVVERDREQRWADALAEHLGHPTTVVLRGRVHDPTARRMGGVAGHAGVFTTASDLARYARMMLRGGELDGIHERDDDFQRPQQPLRRVMACQHLGLRALIPPAVERARLAPPELEQLEVPRDEKLRARGTGSALRDFEAVDALSAGAGFTLLRDVAMPANNRTLVWRKQS